MGEEVEELILRASQGDLEAAAGYFQQNRGLLLGMAHKIGKTTVEPEDLLSEAILSLLEQWRSGKGPTKNVNAYVISSMRNRVLDEVRSPRSRVRDLGSVEEEKLQVEPDVRLVDIRSERLLVAQAFQQLPPEQQRILVETIVNGRKPRELITEFDRPVGAIYTMAHRAKHALKRLILQQIMTKTSRDECVKASRQLPSQLPDTLTDDGSNHGLNHMTGCKHCRRSWARYVSLASLAVVAPLSAFEMAPAPASATSIQSQRSGPLESSGPKSRWLQGSNAPERGMKALLPRFTALIKTLPGQLLIGGIALAVAGTGVTVYNVVERTTPSPAESSPIDATLLVVSEKSSNTLALSSALEVEGPQPTLTNLELTLPAGVSARSYPAGWNCSGAGPVVSCSSPTLLDANFELALQADETDPAGVVLVRVDAQVDSRHVVGDAQIPIRDESSRVFVTLDK